tara:strand:+ start:33 stop:236 length:204 start_codon:yes stop_codon:yes gene_type:complete
VVLVDRFVVVVEVQEVIVHQDMVQVLYKEEHNLQLEENTQLLSVEVAQVHLLHPPLVFQEQIQYLEQ